MRHAENSLFPPKDGVPWSKKYNSMVVRHNEELKLHDQKQALYNKVKAVIHGETVLPAELDLKAEKVAKHKAEKDAVRDKLKDMRYEYLKNGEPKPEDGADAFQMHWLYKTMQHQDNPELSVIYRDALKEDFGHTDQSIDYAVQILKDLEPKKKQEETEREKLIRKMSEGIDDILSKKQKNVLKP